MKRFRLNIGTKLFLLYFIVTSSLLWVFAQRTTFESAKSVVIEVSSLMSRVASQNNKDGEIDLETFETLIVNYLRSQRNTIDKNNPQKLENLAIYVTNKDGQSWSIDVANETCSKKLSKVSNSFIALNNSLMFSSLFSFSISFLFYLSSTRKPYSFGFLAPLDDPGLFNTFFFLLIFR